jgi:hypothetical protein
LGISILARLLFTQQKVYLLDFPGFGVPPKASEISFLSRTPSSAYAAIRDSRTRAADMTPAIAALFQSSTPKTAPPAIAAKALEPNTAAILPHSEIIVSMFFLLFFNLRRY